MEYQQWMISQSNLEDNKGLLPLMDIQCHYCINVDSIHSSGQIEWNTNSG